MVAAEIVKLEAEKKYMVLDGQPWNETARAYQYGDEWLPKSLTTLTGNATIIPAWLGMKKQMPFFDHGGRRRIAWIMTGHEIMSKLEELQ